MLNVTATAGVQRKYKVLCQLFMVINKKIRDMGSPLRGLSV